MATPPRLPNSTSGRTTETVGFFHTQVDDFNRYLTDALGQQYSSRALDSAPVKSHLELVPIRAPLSKYLLLGVDDWTIMFTDGPAGTDLGLIPSRAARDLGVDITIRAVVATDESDSFPGCQFEVHSADSIDAQRFRRAVYAVSDNGKWTFGDFGDPFDFERISTYSNRKVRDRLTPQMIRDYVAALGAPAITVETLAGGHILRHA